MNADRMQGNRQPVKGRAKAECGERADHDFEVVAGRRNPLHGKTQQRDALTMDEAERRLSVWQRQATDAGFGPRQFERGGG